LDIGYRADLLVLNDAHELLTGRQPDVAMDSWVFAGDQAMIESVWVAGRCIVRHGIHSKEESIRTASVRAISELIST